MKDGFSVQKRLLSVLFAFPHNLFCRRIFPFLFRGRRQFLRFFPFCAVIPAILFCNWVFFLQIMIKLCII